MTKTDYRDPVKCKLMWRLHVATVEGDEGMQKRCSLPGALKRHILTNPKTVFDLNNKFVQTDFGQMSKFNSQNTESVSCCIPMFSPSSTRAAVCAIKCWATPACMKKPAF